MYIGIKMFKKVKHEGMQGKGSSDTWKTIAFVEG